MELTYLEQLTNLMNQMQVDQKKLGHAELGYLSVFENLTILIDRNPILFDLVVRQIHELTVKIISENN